MARSIERLVHKYVRETLGLDLDPRPWTRASELPYYLQDALEWYEATILDWPVLLVHSPQEEEVSLSEIRVQVNKARALTGLPVIYAASALASYQRRYLIEQRVPFVVPGNQLYLPDLGIDLREYFRKQTSSTPKNLSPASQAVLIRMLLTATRSEAWASAELAYDLGYSQMTLSRAVRELEAAGLVGISAEGRVKVIRLSAPPAEIWTRASDLMRTPIKSRVRVRHLPTDVERNAPIAGISALSRTTMLAEPMTVTRAISTEMWNLLRGGEIAMASDWDTSATELEIWRYAPTLGEQRSVVDPLSLTLSLRDDKDERVQLALEELEGQYPW